MLEKKFVVVADVIEAVVEKKLVEVAFVTNKLSIFALLILEVEALEVEA